MQSEEEDDCFAPRSGRKRKRVAINSSSGSDADNDDRVAAVVQESTAKKNKTRKRRMDASRFVDDEAAGTSQDDDDAEEEEEEEEEDEGADAAQDKDEEEEEDADAEQYRSVDALGEDSSSSSSMASDDDDEGNETKHEQADAPPRDLSFELEQGPKALKQIVQMLASMNVNSATLAVTHVADRTWAMRIKTLTPSHAACLVAKLTLHATSAATGTLTKKQDGGAAAAAQAASRSPFDVTVDVAAFKKTLHVFGGTSSLVVKYCSGDQTLVLRGSSIGSGVRKTCRMPTLVAEQGEQVSMLNGVAARYQIEINPALLSGTMDEFRNLKFDTIQVRLLKENTRRRRGAGGGNGDGHRPPRRYWLEFKSGQGESLSTVSLRVPLAERQTVRTFATHGEEDNKTPSKTTAARQCAHEIGLATSKKRGKLFLAGDLHDSARFGDDDDNDDDDDDRAQHKPLYAATYPLETLVSFCASGKAGAGNSVQPATCTLLVAPGQMLVVRWPLGGNRAEAADEDVAICVVAECVGDEIDAPQQRRRRQRRKTRKKQTK